MFENTLFTQIEESKAAKKLLIVPAQLTLSAEQAALEGLKKEGFLDLQIMSGNKLRQEILSKTGASGRTAVSSIGRSMILRKCAKDLAESGAFSVYGKAAGSADFLSAAGDFLIQAKQSKEEGFCLPEGMEEETLLCGKLADMEKLSSAYESYMAGKYMDSEDALSFAAKQAEKCPWLSDAEIWLEGFYSFTKNEEAFWQSVEKNCAALHIRKEEAKKEFPKVLAGCYAAGNTEGEGLFIASEILRLIREEGYKPEDILILSGNIACDGPAFRRLFERLGIPVYTDEKKGLTHSPAARKIGLLLDLFADGLRPSLVAEYVHSGELSVYLQQYPVKGKEFLSPLRYGGSKKIEAEKVRDAFALEYTAFEKRMDGAKNVKERCSALYYFLAEDLQLPKNLEEEALSFEEQGYMEAAEESRQIWGVILRILDQMVELLGEELLSAKEFRDVVKEAFADIEIGLLPQKAGCIVIGDIYRTKIHKVKTLFVSSFLDGAIPRGAKEGLLSDLDQKKLKEKGLVLCKDYHRQMAEDREALFGALWAAKEHLYFTYAVSDKDGKENKASYLLHHVKRINGEEDLYTMDGLVERLRSWKLEGEELSPAWKAAAKRLKEGPQKARYEGAVQGLLYTNKERHLKKENKEAMLCPQKASPSGLEKYAACPFSYFVSKGLRPEEMREFKIDARIKGNVYHYLLNEVSRKLSADGKPASSPSSLWMKITEEELKEMIHHLISDLEREDASGLLQRSEEERWRMARIEETAFRFAWNMIYQIRCGNIDRVETEKPFEMTFAGTKVSGTMDRLDTTFLEEETLVKIVDYKSGKITFDKEKIERGLAIQLMLYLEAAMEEGKKMPIGTFYFTIDDPRENVRIEDLALEAAELLSKDYALDGAYIDERVHFVDKGSEALKKSLILKPKQALTAADFEALRETFKEKLSMTIARMNAGNISAAPRILKKGANVLTACTYCPYTAICGFDESVEGYKAEE